MNMHLLTALGSAGLIGVIVFLLVYGVGSDWIRRGPSLLLALGLTLLLSGCVAYETGHVDLLGPSPVRKTKPDGWTFPSPKQKPAGWTPSVVAPVLKEPCMVTGKRGVPCWRQEPPL